jgi:hypothetical protein
MTEPKMTTAIINIHQGLERYFTFSRCKRSVTAQAIRARFTTKIITTTIMNVVDNYRHPFISLLTQILWVTSTE